MSNASEVKSTGVENLEIQDKPQEKQLSRQLSNRHLQLIAIGGTIGTSLFVGSAHVLETTGPSALLIYLLAGVTFFFGMRVLGELLLSNLKYKSFRDATEDLLGPRWGFTIGWLYMLFWVFTCVQDALGVAKYIQFFSHDIPNWLVAIILLVLVTAINLITVKLFGELEFWFAIIKVVAIVIISAICLYFVISVFKFADGGSPAISNLWDVCDINGNCGFFPHGIGGFLNAFQIAFLAYAGIEMVGTASAETKDPERNLPKAINALPLRISLFYIVPMFLLLVVTPWSAFSAQKGSPFVQVFSLAGIGIAAVVMNCVLLSAAASGANSGIYASSRMLFGLSRSNQAPKVFGRLSKVSVPAASVIFTFISAVLIIAVLLISPDYENAYIVVSGMASACFIIAWLLIGFTYLKYLKVHPDRHTSSKFAAPYGAVSAYITIGVLGFCYILTFFDAESLPGAIIAIVALIVLLLAYKYTENDAEEHELARKLYE
ncbi:alanine glycine permease [Actinomycetota bacterium]|nr:alanine glycine permease [Actinomycetota bacterium]